MIIVSGKLYVAPTDRDAYLESCREVIELARTNSGCVDFNLSADPIERGRINVFEQWETVVDVEALRGSGPSSQQTAAIREAVVFQHEIDSSIRL
jgi:quinol monooxygenase YgiN